MSLALQAFLLLLLLILLTFIILLQRQKEKNNLIIKQLDSDLKDCKIRLAKQEKELILAYESFAYSTRELTASKQKAIESLNIKSLFLANMSHEIRTPLNGIIGMLELLNKNSLDAKQVKYFELAKVSANSLLSIVNSILDISKIEAGKLVIEKVPFDIHSLISRT